MKQINTYINEKLRMTSKRQYTCQPKDKKELRQIIIDRIIMEGDECDLNDIDTSKITDMFNLFAVDFNKIFKNFNGDISMWDVSNVKDMRYMFFRCENFNCDISYWNVSKVDNMNNMFSNCTNFNCDISKWDVSNVEDMQYIFYNCEEFNQDLDSWNVSHVKNMNYAFYNCPTRPEWYINKK